MTQIRLSRSLRILALVLLTTGWPMQSAMAQLKAETLSGDRKSSQVDSLIQLGNTALQNGKFGEAQSIFKAALVLMPTDETGLERQADVILLLAQAYLSANNLLSARDLLEKHWFAIERHPDPERLDRANYFMLTVFMQSADYKNALKYSGALVNRSAERHGSNHALTLDAQLNHGTALVNAGEVDVGIALLDKSFDGLSVLGDKDLYQSRLNMIATNFEAIRNFDLASRYYLRLIDELKKQPISRTLGISYFNLATLKKTERKLDEALPLHEHALEILTKVAGPDDVDTIAAVSGLGNTYTVLGRPASGIQFLEQGYLRAKKVIGENSNETWMYANNYANALRELEKFEEARAVDQAAYDWRVKNLGANDIATEISTLNLGLDLMGLKRFAEADKKFEELYQSRRKRLGEDHPDTKDAAKFLALSQSYNPKNSSNAKLSDKDIDKLDRLSANIRAGAFEQQGKPKQALLFHRRAFLASIEENGPVDPTTLLMLRNLALSEREVEGKDGHVIQSYEDLNKRTLEWARTEIAATAGNARAEDIRRVANRMIYDVIKLAQENPKAHHLLFQVLMDWKGLGTTEQALLNQLRNNPPNQQVADLVKRLQDLQKSLRQPGQNDDQIQSEIRLNEVKLAQFSTSFFRTRAEAAIKPKDIVAQLKSDEVLIDYIIGDRVLPDSVSTEQEVFAFVTLADGRAIVKSLGKLSAITDILSKPGYQTDSAMRKKLFDILLKPILKMKSVSKLKNVYLVPDGELFLVPFEGLLNDRNEAFGAQFNVTLMRSSTGLLLSQMQPPKDAGIVLVGAPDYGKAEGALSFSALPAALKEVTDIQTMARNKGYTTALITGTAATEADVRQAVNGQAIVHMATHGFFLPKEFDTSLEPPWRGGLALGQANSAIPNGKTNDDGIAYAAELSSWGFDKTDLVVLSACETASGERSYVEGLRGIPAALATSGAKLSLLALWEVPDEGAANFMTAFYDHLLVQGLKYEDAYRVTKRDAMAGKIMGAESPDVWQAFVMMRN